MPHIVLEGPVDLYRFYSTYRPFASQTAGEVLKLQGIFINQPRDTLLIEALTVEGGPPSRFLVQAGSKGLHTTVRIYPGSDPEKTPGVKKILALVARQLKELSPDIRYGSTNLTEFLI